MISMISILSTVLAALIPLLFLIRDKSWSFCKHITESFYLFRQAQQEYSPMLGKCAFTG